VRTVSALLAAAGGVALLAAGTLPVLAATHGAVTPAPAPTHGGIAPQIANGTPVAEGQYGFATKLTMTNIPRPDGTHYNGGCSGALIAQRWIITAGHCFHDVNRKPVSGPVPYTTTATIGRTDDADTTGHVVSVIEDYQSPISDVAIAKLAQPVTDVAPLTPGPAMPSTGEVLRLTGWGALNDVNPVPATHLQTGQFKVVAVSDTIVGVVGYQPQPNTSPCLDDSGAPYFVEAHWRAPRLVAVESDGPSCPHTQTETTSRVDVLLPWIYKTVSLHR
jgi:secreted trypsin-like serine protease